MAPAAADSSSRQQQAAVGSRSCHQSGGALLSLVLVLDLGRGGIGEAGLRRARAARLGEVGGDLRARVEGRELSAPRRLQEADARLARVAASAGTRTLVVQQREANDQGLSPLRRTGSTTSPRSANWPARRAKVSASASGSLPRHHGEARQGTARQGTARHGMAPCHRMQQFRVAGRCTTGAGLTH